MSKNTKFINIQKHAGTHKTSRLTHWIGCRRHRRYFQKHAGLSIPRFTHTNTQNTLPLLLLVLPPSLPSHTLIARSMCACVFVPFCPFPESAVKYMIWSVKFCVKRHVIKFPFISMAKSWDVWRRFTLIWNFMFLLNWLLILKSAYLNWDALMVIH